jgi:hypothetical protein
MWGRVGRRNAKRSKAVGPPLGALGRVVTLFGREKTRPARTPYGGALGLGIGALAVVATISLVMLLRRRAARQDNLIEEANEEISEEV